MNCPECGSDKIKDCGRGRNESIQMDFHKLQCEVCENEFGEPAL